MWEQIGFSTLTFPLGILKVSELDVEPQLREGRSLSHPFSSNIFTTGLLGNCSCFRVFRDALRGTSHTHLFVLPDTVVQNKQESFGLLFNWKKMFVCFIE